MRWVHRGLIGCSLLAMLAGCGNSGQTARRPSGGGGMRDGGAASTDSGAAAAPMGEGWGTLSGQFVFVGDPPSLPPIDTMGKDAQVCDLHPIPNQAIVVDPSTKGIANVVVMLRKASRVFEAEREVPKEPYLFDQKGCVFLTHVGAVRVGQEVTIANSDPLSHNTNITPVADQPINAILTQGQSASYTFNRKQSKPVPVACNVHQWMKAYLIPRDDPYVAVSDAEGRFEIANLPAGEELEFEVWHESAPKGLEAKPDWARGRFKVTVPADGVEDLGTIEVDASKFELP